MKAATWSSPGKNWLCSEDLNGTHTGTIVNDISKMSARAKSATPINLTDSFTKVDSVQYELWNGSVKQYSETVKVANQPLNKVNYKINKLAKITYNQSLTAKIRFHTLGYGWSDWSSVGLSRTMTNEDKINLDKLNSFAGTKHPHPLNLESDFRVNFEKYLSSAKTTLDVKVVSRFLKHRRAYGEDGIGLTWKYHGGSHGENSRLIVKTYMHVERHENRNYQYLINNNLYTIRHKKESFTRNTTFREYVRKIINENVIAREYTYSTHVETNMRGPCNIFSLYDTRRSAYDWTRIDEKLEPWGFEPGYFYGWDENPNSDIVWKGYGSPVRFRISVYGKPIDDCFPPEDIRWRYYGY